MRTKTKRRFSVEDPGGWFELQRTPDIKEYSAAFRRLIFRSARMRVVSLFVAGFITWTLIRVYGIGAGQGGTDNEKHIALLVSIAWLAIIVFFVAPVIAAVYRGRWMRVTTKLSAQASSSNRPGPYDQDAN